LRNRTNLGSSQIRSTGKEGAGWWPPGLEAPYLRPGSRSNQHRSWRRRSPARSPEQFLLAVTNRHGQEAIRTTRSRPKRRSALRLNRARLDRARPYLPIGASVRAPNVRTERHSEEPDSAYRSAPMRSRHSAHRTPVLGAASGVKSRVTSVSIPARPSVWSCAPVPRRRTRASGSFTVIDEPTS
jgi:hypothetical protein